MSDGTRGQFPRRERRARLEADPQLVREHYEITIGGNQAESLTSFLRSRGIRIVEREDDFVAILRLDRNTDLELVESMVERWLNGEDLTGSPF